MADFIRILTIDGGGIRGIIPGQILVKLEQILQQKTNNPAARVADYFDLIAGTSTGGILTCLHLVPDRETLPERPRFSAQEAVDHYLTIGPRIFRHSIWHRFLSLFGLVKEKYPSKYIESCLKELFGDTRLSQLIKPCLITSYNIEKRYAHFFTKHDAAEDPHYDFWIADVTRAAAAAPTYFKAAGVRSLRNTFFPLIDGGVFANNPALCAFSESHRLFERVRTTSDMVILSLGTGEDERPILYRKASRWGIIQWAVPILSVLMSGNPETVDYQLQTIFAAADCPNQYLRIDPYLPDEMTAMDNTSAKNLQGLLRVGQEAAAQNELELIRFADFLIAGTAKPQTAGRQKEIG